MGKYIIYRHACHRGNLSGNDGLVYLNPEPGCSQEDVPYNLPMPGGVLGQLKSFDCPHGVKTCAVCQIHDIEIPTVFQYIPARCNNCRRTWCRRMATITAAEVGDLARSWKANHPELSLDQAQDRLVEIQTTITMSIINPIVRAEISALESWFFDSADLIPWGANPDMPAESTATPPNDAATPVESTTGPSRKRSILKKKFSRMFKNSNKDKSVTEVDSELKRDQRWHQVQEGRKQFLPEAFRGVDPLTLRADILDLAKEPGRFANAGSYRFITQGSGAHRAILSTAFLPYEDRMRPPPRRQTGPREPTERPRAEPSEPGAAVGSGEFCNPRKAPTPPAAKEPEASAKWKGKEKVVVEEKKWKGKEKEEDKNA
ncbi:hypothetical protein QBC44DRAFT_370474 [Cladorrhinum sp. PSN332]|nr:hypothetical protein QBC44DRAFT_370474 [Cladorrhinum sp. PSN332]